MEKLSPQNGWWRAFAVIVALILLILGIFGPPTHLGLDLATARFFYWLLAPLGLVGYAFGVQILTSLFWRVYAVLFTVEILVRSVPLALVPIARLLGEPETSRHGTGTILLVLTVFALTSLACCATRG